MSQQQQNQSQFDGDDDNCVHSIEGSEWSSMDKIGGGNAEENESHLKMALLEAKNQILEGKLENLELKAQIRAMQEESNLNKLKEKNRTIRQKQKEAEENTEMAKNELASTIKTIHLKVIESAIEIAILKEQMKKQEASNLDVKLDSISLEKPGGKILDVMKLDNISLDDLVKDKIKANNMGNRWEDRNYWSTKISLDGLTATHRGNHQYECVFAWEVDISEYYRKDNSSGMIIDYFEVKVIKMPSYANRGPFVGFSNGHIANISNATNTPNCYAVRHGDNYCFISDKIHDFKGPNDAVVKPEWHGFGDIVGCGFLMSAAKEVFIFFTLNGILMGKPFPIDHPGDKLCPTVHICDASLEANFGNDMAEKPFCYKIDKCPSLVSE